MTNFKKGDKVILMYNWNRKGTLKIRPCVVHSCGKKQMILLDPVTGEELGTHFLPDVQQYDQGLVLPAADYDEALAFRHGEYAQAVEMDRVLNVLKRGPSRGYERNLDELITFKVSVENYR